MIVMSYAFYHFPPFFKNIQFYIEVLDFFFLSYEATLNDCRAKKMFLFFS